MQLEVEQKFSVDTFDDLQARLIAAGAEDYGTVLEADLYFAHPSRDFAQTDEAFRIRRVGERNWVTYKGPKLESQTKTRHELELPLVDGESSARRFREMLVALGFAPVAEVRKQRGRWKLSWQEFEAQVVLDSVEEVGTFAEVEIVAQDSQLNEARDAVLSLAASLGLTRSERRSYLEMLLSRKAGEPNS